MPITSIAREFTSAWIPGNKAFGGQDALPAPAGRADAFRQEVHVLARVLFLARLTRDRGEELLDDAA